MNDALKPLGAEEVARALLDPSAPVTDPAVQLLQVAMSGFGYNFYDARNVARANDQLVRGRANDVLCAAASTLGALEKAYMARAFPEATRETPYPPPEVMRTVRAIDAAAKRLRALASAIVAAETPATDSIWFRFRDEHALLTALVAYDLGIANAADALAGTAGALSASSIGEDALGSLDAEIDALDRLFQARRKLLRGESVQGPGTQLSPRAPA